MWGGVCAQFWFDNSIKAMGEVGLYKHYRLEIIVVYMTWKYTPDEATSDDPNQYEKSRENLICEFILFCGFKGIEWNTLKLQDPAHIFESLENITFHTI